MRPAAALAGRGRAGGDYRDHGLRQPGPRHAAVQHVGDVLWQQGAATEKGLSEDSLAFNRRYFDYCRENALTPGGFSMRRCLGGAHDWFMKDLNVNYWKSLKPTS